MVWCVGVCGWVRAFVVDRRDRSIENCIHFIKHTNVRFGLEGEELELDREEPEDGVDGEDEEDEHVQRREELLVVGRLVSGGLIGAYVCTRQTENQNASTHNPTSTHAYMHNPPIIAHEYTKSNVQCGRRRSEACASCP